MADKFSMIRSLHHDNGDHFTAAHYILTSRGGPNGVSHHGPQSIDRFDRRKDVRTAKAGPAGVRLRAVRQQHRLAARLLCRQLSGFAVQSLRNRRRSERGRLSTKQSASRFEALTIDRLEDRNALRTSLDQLRRNVDASGALDSMDRFQQQAYELVTSDATRKAFDIASEDAKLRDRYGRHTFGQSTLLARRLVEAGSTFVTVHYGGWDHHWDLKAGMENNLPIVDAAVSSLLTDLSDRGLLDKVMVMLCGEFSRTPRMNDGGNGGPPMSMGTPGRDHWGNAMSVLVAGGGIQGGRIVGSTDRLGEFPKDRPITPGDLHATIYKVLGVDPTTHFLDRSGRPVAAIDSGKVIEELF